MKTLLITALFLPLSVFAHPGHPGAEGHGDLTHLLIGLAVALPILGIAAGFSLHARRKAAVKVSKKD